MTVLGKVFIPFSSGILVSYFLDLKYPLPVNTEIYLISLIIIVYLVFIRTRILTTVLVYTLLLLTGFMLSEHELQSLEQEQHLQEVLDKKEQTLSFKIHKSISQKPKQKLVANINMINGIDVSILGIKVLLHFNSDHPPLVRSNSYTARAYFRMIPEIKNPYVFNKKKFYKLKGIHLEAFCKDVYYESELTESNSACLRVLINCRQWIKRLIAKNFPDPRHRSIINAMILGDRSELSYDTRQSFSNTGSSHILAISGLHIGILFSILNLLLACMNANSILKFLKMLILISLLWMYCMLVGNPNSVLRACAMISMYLLGVTIFRVTSVYNIVSCAALGILILSPLELFDLSYQFSFLALLGILFFFKRINLASLRDNKLATTLIQVFIVSTCAQILIFPILIYHFNKFPNYFFISNYAAISFAYVILTSSILLFLLHGLGFEHLEAYVTDCVMIASDIFLKILSKLESLPGSLSDELYLPIIAIAIIYLALLCLIHGLSKKNSFSIIVSLLLVLNAFSFRSLDKSFIQNRARLYIHYSHKGSLVNLLTQGSAYQVHTTLDHDFSNYLSSKLQIRYYSSNKDLSFDHLKECLSINGKNILVKPSSELVRKFEHQNVDLVLLDSISFNNLKLLKQLPKISQVICDGSSDYPTRMSIEKWCSELHIPFYDVTQSGYYAYQV